MNESMSNVLQKPWVIPTVVGVLAAGGGFAGGYFLGKKKGVSEFLDEVNSSFAPKFEDAVETTRISETLVQPEDLVDEPDEDESIAYEVPDEDIPEEPFPGVIEPSDGEPKQTFTEYMNKVKEAKYAAQEEDDVDDETEIEEPPRAPTRVNIFDSSSEEWDYDKQDKVREKHPDGPYVIHVDEFVRNDLGYQQETLTYYAGDDVVADQNDSAVHNYPGLMGELKFGFGSNDPSVVYIRNAGIRMEWEILLHTGSYETEVQGLNLEEEYEAEDLKHSNRRKFRPVD